jgi:hypothetical protein
MQNFDADTTKTINQISKDNNADIYLFNSGIAQNPSDQLISVVTENKSRRENVILIISTYGGDGDSAFRMIRCLKRNYKKVIIYVFGYCKSAGTLIALGADEIVISEFGELGPLDIQMIKNDDFFSRNSGLDIIQAIQLLSGQSVVMFESMFSELLTFSGGILSTKTASDIANTTVVGLLSPIFSQIDPLRLGAMNRANGIAREYGVRLCNNQEAVEQLLVGYPTHGFVIDYEEARRLLGDIVRQPNQLESVLESSIREHTRIPAQSGIVLKICEPLSEDSYESTHSTASSSGEQLSREIASEEAIQTSNDRRPENDGESSAIDGPPNPDIQN